MKVLHINTSQNGGAAWCAMKICGALSRRGVDSRLLVAEGESLPPGIDGAVAERDSYLWQKNHFFTRCKHLYNRLPWVLDADKMSIMLLKASATLPKDLYLHQPLSFYTNISHHPLIEWADVIHLHWVADFVDYSSFFKEVKKPIVWTLHDKYPIEGLQHYCSNWYPVPNQLQSLDSLCRRIKRKGCQQSDMLHVVAISEQMKALCETSDIFYDVPCSLIHNGVDVNSFTPKEKMEARSELWGCYKIEQPLAEDAIVFLFSSYHIWDQNKGLQRAIDALEIVSYPNIILIVVGDCSQGEKPKSSFPIVYTGLIASSQELAKIYSSADFFLQASFEETFSQTTLEAMSCGVPVITTPVSGTSDLIRPFNGVICSGYSPAEIMVGIEEALSKGYDSTTIRSNIVNEFSIDFIAKEYLKLYESMLT